jgi:hypothetical protein
MHHATKKAAIAKYQPLVAEGKPEADIKAAIAADEKHFSDVEQAEIYAAITGTAEVSYTVIQPFRDINNFDKLYELDEEVSHLDADRLQTLVEKGLIQKND